VFHPVIFRRPGVFGVEGRVATRNGENTRNRLALRFVMDMDFVISR